MYIGFTIKNQNPSYISMTSHSKQKQNHLQNELWRLEQFNENYGPNILLVKIPKMHLWKIREIE